MLLLPQKNFRGQLLSFAEFYDLIIIGMVGLSDALMSNGPPAFSGGMVNYKRVADNLGLIYEPDWIDDVGHELENRIEAIATHDGPPDGEEDDGHWVNLNSGICADRRAAKREVLSANKFRAGLRRVPRRSTFRARRYGPGPYH